MTIQRMEHVDLVVDDLAAATGFFVELGLKLTQSRVTGQPVQCPIRSALTRARASA